MYRRLNFLIISVTIVGFFLTIFIYYDLQSPQHPLTIFNILAGIITALVISRTIIRWSPIKTYNQKIEKKDFLFETEMSQIGKSDQKSRLIIESCMEMFVALYFLSIIKPSMLLGLGYLLLVLENLWFIILSSKKPIYKLGLSKNYLIACKNKPLLINLKEVKSITLRAGYLQFEKDKGYVTNLNISSIPDDHMDAFIETLNQVSEIHGIRIDGIPSI